MDKKTLMRILAEKGIKITEEEIPDEPIENQKSTKQRSRWEAESLLLCLKWPYPELTKKNCLSCGEVFLTDYQATGYCSNECVKNDFKKYGLTWHPEKSFQEQWGLMEPPLIIPPELLKAMRRLLKIAKTESQDQSHSQEPDSVKITYEEEKYSVYESYVSPDTVVDTPKEHEPDSDFLALLAALDE